MTNDNLVNLLGAVLGYVALRFVMRQSAWNMVWVGLTFGLLVATKLSTLPMGLVIVFLRSSCPPGAGDWSCLPLPSEVLCSRVVGISSRTPSATGIRWPGWHVAIRHSTGASACCLPYRVTDPLHLYSWMCRNRLVTTYWYESGWNQFTWKRPLDLAITGVVLVVLLGLFGQKIPRRVTFTLVTVAVAGLLSVWIVATQTSEYQGRYALVGCVGTAGLIALALQRWKLPVRFVLPAAGVVGTCIAIQSNVLSIHWT